MKKQEVYDWLKTFHPEMSERQVWVEFYRFCRTKKIGDIHSQTKLLLFMAKFFSWEWVQMIRQDYGSDPLAHPFSQRFKMYKMLKRITPHWSMRRIVANYMGVKTSEKI